MSYPTHGPEYHERQSWKVPCRAATTANITISTALNNGDTLDGVTLATGDRVLVKNQSSGAENGIYIVGASPARSVDFGSSAEIVGAVVVVLEGTANADTTWMCTTNATITVGTTAIVFAAFGSSGITVQDEGTPLATAGTTLDFVGAGVTASGTGATKTITISGGGQVDNLSASTAPTANDDAGDGYSVGSRWIDTTNDIEYVCVDSTTTAAIWLLTGSKIVAYTPTWGSSGTAPAIGDGTITGKYHILAPGLMWVYIRMVLGASSTVGTGAYTWSLPAGFTFTNLHVGGPAAYRDNSTTQRATGLVLVSGTTAVEVRDTSVQINATPWGATIPVNPPAASDSYDLTAMLQYT